MLTSICLPTLALMLPVWTSPVSAEWVNNWDEPARLECPNYQIMSFIGSIHSNRHEDRRWQYHCRDAPNLLKDCYWTGYVNDFDAPLLYSCGDNGVLNGMDSYHNDHYEDRRFSLLCCKWRSPRGGNCNFGDYINSWDGEMIFNVPGSSYIRGVYSIHDNHRKDRIWKIQLCDL